MYIYVCVCTCAFEYVYIYKHMARIYIYTYIYKQICMYMLPASKSYVRFCCFRWDEVGWDEIVSSVWGGVGWGNNAQPDATL